MSGHSHWASIKHKKGLADEKRGKIFSKMTRLIAVTARDGGGDLDSNYKLRMAIDQAKQVNMPKDNIERAIKKGTGELKGDQLESVIFEAYGPDNIALIIEGITDNKNRTRAEIKQILHQYNGKLASEGSVKWLFARKGIIMVQKSSNELEIIDTGVEDINSYEDILEVYTKPEDLENVKKKLEEKGIKVESSLLGWVAKETVEGKDYDKLFEALNDNDDIQNIYSNLKA